MANKPTANSVAKQARIEHANNLIKVISSYGRRFFYHADTDAVAYLSLDNRGRVWHHDEYTKARVYTHRTSFGNDWCGFNHGGTLRALIEVLRDYVLTGKPLARGWIAPGGYSDGDLWGYGEAAEACRAACFELPVMAPARETAA